MEKSPMKMVAQPQKWNDYKKAVDEMIYRDKHSSSRHGTHTWNRIANYTDASGARHSNRRD